MVCGIGLKDKYSFFFNWLPCMFMFYFKDFKIEKENYLLKLLHTNSEIIKKIAKLTC